MRTFRYVLIFIAGKKISHIWSWDAVKGWTIVTEVGLLRERCFHDRSIPYRCGGRDTKELKWIRSGCLMLRQAQSHYSGRSFPWNFFVPIFSMVDKLISFVRPALFTA